jgi:hypothetical protein
MNEDSFSQTQTCVDKAPDSNIESATNVNQFELYDPSSKKLRRLVTIIGEHHEQTFECGGANDITIYQYLKKRVLDNEHCRFLLEYHPDLPKRDVSKIGTEVIRSVYSTSDEVNGSIQDRVVGVDIRENYITRDGQSLLYNEDQAFRKRYVVPMKLGAIMEDFIEPFDVKKLERDFPIPRNCANRNDLEKYLESVSATFNDCYLSFESCLMKTTDVTDCVHKLKVAWAKVMDYVILLQLCSFEKEVNEVIVVVGEFHRQNISSVLKEWSHCRMITGTKELNDVKSKNNCVRRNKLKVICKKNSIIE